MTRLATLCACPNVSGQTISDSVFQPCRQLKTRSRSRACMVFVRGVAPVLTMGLAYLFMSNMTLFAETVNQTGPNGTNGTNGAPGNPGQDGGPGTDGDDAVAAATANDPSNTATATGGTGGTGGNGGAGNTAGADGGAGGPGGNGGDATASSQNAPPAGNSTANATANGGGGGERRKCRHTRCRWVPRQRQHRRNRGECQLHGQYDSDVNVHRYCHVQRHGRCRRHRPRCGRDGRCRRYGCGSRHGNVYRRKRDSHGNCQRRKRRRRELRVDRRCRCQYDAAERSQRGNFR